MSAEHSDSNVDFVPVPPNKTPTSDTGNSLDVRIMQSVKDILEGDTVTKIVEQVLTKTITDVVEDLFKSWGGAGSAIRQKIEGQLVDAINNYDISAYVPKLDAIITEVLKDPALMENKKILDNFKGLITPRRIETLPRSLSELFEAYCDYVSKHVETDGLEVIFDSGPHYEEVSCSLDVELIEADYYSRECAMLRFRCDEDEECNFDVPMYKWDSKENWKLDYYNSDSISSIASMNEFTIMLTKLSQAFARLQDDIQNHYISESVEPEEEPEPTYQ